MKNHDVDGSANTTERFASDVFDATGLPDAPGLRRASSVDPMDFLSLLRLPASAWVPHGAAGRCDVVTTELDGAVLAWARLPSSHFDVTAADDEVRLAFGMDEDHRTVLNGVEVPSASVTIGPPGTRCVGHWPTALVGRQTFASLSLPVARAPATWMRGDDLFTVHHVSEGSARRLRRFVEETFREIAGAAAPADAETASRRLAALIAEIDAALCTGRPVPTPSALATKGYLRLIDRIDDHVVDHFADRIRLEDVADALRVSRRTIHNVTTRIRGVTFQEHLRLLRLRCARFALLHDRSIHLVKQAAIRCGFVHQGRFAQDYAERFGEPPSLTLARRAPPPDACDAPALGGAKAPDPVDPARRRTDSIAE